MLFRSDRAIRRRSRSILRRLVCQTPSSNLCAVEALFDAEVAKVNVRNTKNGKLASVKLAEGYYADEAAMRLGAF